MQRFQEGCLQKVKRKNGMQVWTFRWYEQDGDKRTYRKRVIGTVAEMPTRRDAEKHLGHLREKINSAIRLPETVDELIAHYKINELTEEAGKRSSTREVYTGFLDLHVSTKWGEMRLDQVKTFAVEQWLRSLPMAPGSKAKIRNIMSALFAHGMRHEMLAANPIKGVRCSAKRLRDPDLLAPAEFIALMAELPEREQVMVLVAGTTSLRRSELIALKWEDVDFKANQIIVNKSCVRAKMGETKTLASARPVPLHPLVAAAIEHWRTVTLYVEPNDFLFPSIRKNGVIPVWPDMILQKIIRPALVRAGIVGKRIGWHTFRHSLATNLRFLGVDVKTAQELLRHANSRITLDLYTQAVSSDKLAANNKIVEMLIPTMRKLPNPSEPTAMGREVLEA